MVLVLYGEEVAKTKAAQCKGKFVLKKATHTNLCSLSFATTKLQIRDMSTCRPSGRTLIDARLKATGDVKEMTAA